MLRRCFDPRDPAFARYGGRGITVCPEWRAFQTFLADMGQRPSSRHSLDRWPDNDGNYGPQNCRWAVQKQQMRNTRRNSFIEIEGAAITIAEAAERALVKESTLRHRVSAGWSPSDALGPVTKRRGLRPRVFIDLAGQWLSLVEACEQHRLCYGTVRRKMRRGMTFDEARASLIAIVPDHSVQPTVKPTVGMAKSPDPRRAAKAIMKRRIARLAKARDRSPSGI